MVRAAARAPVPDVLAPGIRLLLVGINPGHVSARAGHHFANPANAFWRLLHESGLTPRRLAPHEEQELLRHGIGLTNLVARESAGVADLTAEDFDRGRKTLARKLAQHHPPLLGFVGVTAYREFARAAGRPIPCGEQEERVAGARTFVLPNPSGRNAHFRYEEMLQLFREVARAHAALAGAPRAPRATAPARSRRRAPGRRPRQP